MIPDIKTLMLLYTTINVIGFGAIAIIWHQNRKRFAGISFWLADMALQAVGSSLIFMRGSVADFISIVLANTMIQAGALIIFIGIERFVEKKSWQVHNYILLAVFVFIMVYFSSIQPNLTVREITLSAMTMIFTFQCCWLLLRRVAPSMRQITRITGIVFAGYAAFSFVRIILHVVFPSQSNDFFKSGAVDSLAITIYIVLSACLTISLILMMNRRLLGEIQIQEEKFAKAFHSAPYAITLTRASDSTIFEVNNGFVHLTGYQYTEVIGETTLGLPFWVRQEDRSAFVNELSKGNGVREMEAQFRKKTGEVITGLISADTIMINNQKCILSSIIDITERKQAEEKLRDAEARYRGLFEQSPDGITIIDTETTEVVEFNDAACKQLGYSRDEFAGMKVADFDAMETAEEIRRNIDQTWQAGITEFVTKHRTKQGEIRDVMIRSKPIDIAGKIYHLSIHRDITKQKRMEDELKLRAQLLDNATDSIALHDLDGNFIYVNETACNYRGYSREELMKINLYQLVPPEYRERRKQQSQVLIENGTAIFETANLRKDGSVILLEVNARVIESGGKRLILSVARDISERKQMQDSMVIADRLSALGEMSLGFSHELNNPLNTVIGYAQLVLEDKNITENTRIDVERIHSQAQRAAEVIKNFLFFAQRQSPAKQPTDINSIINTVLKLREYEDKIKNINVITKLSPDLPVVMANVSKLQQVFLNILINAEYFMLKAHNKGTLTVTTERAGDIVKASFADDGPGISKENLANIFNPFFTTKEVGQGTGLGLSICHGIISEHGGRIYAESEPGKGATFVVELPVAK